MTQETHSEFIPAEFELATNATNRQNRRVLRSSLRGYSSAPAGTLRRPPAWKNTFCPGKGSPYHRESSAVRPADSSGSCSGIRVSITNKPRGKYYSGAASRTVPVRRLPLCAHIPRSAAQPAEPLSPPTGFNCDSNVGGFRAEDPVLPSPSLWSHSSGFQLPDSDTRLGSHGPVPSSAAPPAL